MIPGYAFEDFSPRELLIEQLEIAKAHVRTSERHIAEQKRLIGNLRRMDRDTASAEETLRALEGVHAMHVAHRDKLGRDLATANPE